MIKRIELINFMSHEHTVIEPAQGLTVLVGPNNCGKSAVVAALQILCTNERSTYVMRHEEKHCSVKIETSDGHSVEWRRKTSPSYLIDGQEQSRIKSGLPPILHEVLKLPQVETSGDPVDVHFGAQKSPIFLLDCSGGIKAQFFAASSDALKLIAMQRRHKEQLAERQRDKTRLEAEAKRVNEDLAILEPVVTLDQRLETTEQAHCDLLRAEEHLLAARRMHEQLLQQNAETNRWECEAHSLAFLKTPPALAPEAPLVALIESLKSSRQEFALAQATHEALDNLLAPPELADEKNLALTINGLRRQTSEVALTAAQEQALSGLQVPPQIANTHSLARLAEQLAVAQKEQILAEAVSQALGTIATPPIPVDSGVLLEFIRQLEQGVNDRLARESELETASEQFALAANQLRKSVAGAACPTCGSPLDPERVLARAAAGIGAHDHV